VFRAERRARWVSSDSVGSVSSGEEGDEVLTVPERSLGGSWDCIFLRYSST
jgi:hypothetical protein